MDILLGVTTKDSVLLVTSKASARGITVIKATDDKTRVLNNHTLMAFSGEPGDTVNFAEYLQVNAQLYGMRHGIDLSPKALACFTRNTLATSLRSRKPYQVNLLIGGYDKKTDSPTLNWIDYLGANVELPYAAHGYASYYVLSLLDRHFKPGMSEEEGAKLVQFCVDELKLRMPIDFKGVLVKAVDKDGIRELSGFS